MENTSITMPSTDSPPRGIPNNGTTACETAPSLESKVKRAYYWRSLVSFWIFGLSCHFAYWIMLSAAFDIMTSNKEGRADDGVLLTARANQSSSYVSKVNVSANGSLLKYIVSVHGHLKDNASAYGSFKDNASAYGSLKGNVSAYGSFKDNASAYGSLKDNASSTGHFNNNISVNETFKNNSSVHRSFIGNAGHTDYDYVHIGLRGKATKVNFYNAISNTSSVFLYPRETSPVKNEIVCNHVSTGVLLIVEIPITIFVKATFPFIADRLSFATKTCIFSAITTGSFLLIAFFHDSMVLTMVGMAIVSTASSVGDIIFFGLTASYHKNVVSSLCSASGAAGLISAFVYGEMVSQGMSLRDTFLAMISVPVISLLTYLFVLGKPLLDVEGLETSSSTIVDDSTLLVHKTKCEAVNHLTLKEKLRIVPSLFKYMGPGSSDLFLQYFINQGLHELLYFNDLFLTKNEQYAWYQFAYRLGVFIARSSSHIFQINKIWVPPLLQLFNVCILLCQIYFRFIPSFWIVLLIILWEGLVGGTTYVNTYLKLTKEVPEGEKEFSIGMCTSGDSAGLSLAGALSIPVHDFICNAHMKMS